MVAGSAKGVDGCMFRVVMKGIEVIAHLGMPISEILCRGVVVGSYGAPPSMESPEVERVTSLGRKWFSTWRFLLRVSPAMVFPLILIMGCFRSLSSVGMGRVWREREGKPREFLGGPVGEWRRPREWWRRPSENGAK
ncbi:hypothetical protein TIFTF001_021977 [Ficus carica]|uniref:Uncharacterized protein n=1 Tax=Ficus carica TaxID=3494 RepID=A0AA88AIG0_FICCA|nr:hypothetical protein TIFTF001_021977 [Ficus carica]